MNSLLFGIMFGWGLGGGEIVLILALVLILFGAKKLPELAKGLGTGIKEFKKATREVTDEIQNSTNDNYTPLPPPKRQVETPQSTPEPTVAQTSEPSKPASAPASEKKS
jgi:sec-independent protein translocase protein TatA